MANALKKITTRAKQLQKKHPNSKWVSLIKKAGAEYRSGKLGAAKKKAAKKRNPFRQTGSSSKRYDEMRSARPPGKGSLEVEKQLPILREEKTGLMYRVD